jgi:6-phospho-beta-glucosidase
VHAGGVDHLPRLLADPETLSSFEEGKLFGADWLQTLGAIPNPYLHYYYYNPEAVAAARAAARTRGAFLLDQQQHFYKEVECAERAYEVWDRTRLEREATYMAENREAAGAGERDASDLESGGYEHVALALMRAIARDQRTSLILNVRNRRTLDLLDADAVIEVRCTVDAKGARPDPTDPLPDYAAGLVGSVKAVERAVIEAAATGSRAAALRAMAIHPLVDSVAVARRLLDGYQRQLPELAYLRA